MGVVTPERWEVPVSPPRIVDARPVATRYDVPVPLVLVGVAVGAGLVLMGGALVLLADNFLTVIGLAFVLGLIWILKR